MTFSECGNDSTVTTEAVSAGGGGGSNTSALNNRRGSSVSRLKRDARFSANLLSQAITAPTIGKQSGRLVGGSGSREQYTHHRAATVCQQQLNRQQTRCAFHVQPQHE